MSARGPYTGHGMLHIDVSFHLFEYSFFNVRRTLIVLILCVSDVDYEESTGTHPQYLFLSQFLYTGMKARERERERKNFALLNQFK